ncbi:NAD+ synthase [Nodosilinea sp. LEGE 07088]|uniref:NAD+ synthase n=1 Tax=Nodosilinea sp. LEGE 07088 TaxID=2777968 RepID=UPI00187F4479|nr:NAD+ synthase [Nodosilinea sp. LEGE 07088]MBE9136067.1 NAD+ synthase [Nodosilinea sp. LEGE 07088]
MKFAIAQLNPTIGDLAHNAQQVLNAARQADQLGAQILVTTELVLCGYPPRDLLLRPSFIQAMAQTLEDLALALPPHLAVLVGYAAANPKARYSGEKPLFNSTALLQGGQVQQVFHKQLLPTYDVFDEDRYFAPGQGPSSFTLPCGDWGIRVGVTICEDLWNDEEFWGGRSYARNPIADLAGDGVDLVINLSASPYSLHKAQLRSAMLAHSAARFRCPILYANQVGANDDLIFDGASLAFDRQGELVARLPAFQAGLAVVDYDPVKGDLTPGEVAPLPTDDNEALWSALVLGVRDYTHKCGFAQAVIGLSGGIDSALVAAIAAAALGPDNVLGVLMPSPYSSAHSVSDALALAQALGIAHQTLAIGPLMADYDQVLDPLFADTSPGIAEENIQSRIRGNLLMAISNKFGHLLLSTGNKSEMAVGYCTLYGDMNGGLAVIADVPKTRVYALCQWLNQQVGQGSNGAIAPVTLGTLATRVSAQGLIPQNILDKPPSAELKPGQVDQDSLPPYDVLDDILDRLVQRHESIADMVAAGHDAAVVEKVLRLVSRAEFKRRQAPPVLKVTDRAFGMGWRMPIANRWRSEAAVHPLTAEQLLEA